MINKGQHAGTAMSEKSDQELVRRVQAGDNDAFNILVQRYQPRILNLTSRYVSDRTAAYDITQETFIKAWRGLARFRGDSQFYTWLFRIAINTAKNYLTSASRRFEQPLAGSDDPSELSIEDLQVDYDTPEQEAQADELRSALNHAFTQLSEDLRVAIVLREIEGMSYEEIAHTMNCPVGTVRSRIFRAREALDQILSPLIG